MLYEVITIAAESATQRTLKYCMKATMRTSAPNSSAITTIAEAAPAEEPQIPAVPGRTRQRLIAQPTTPLAATVANTNENTTGALATTESRVSGLITPAIIVPTTAWAQT